MSIKVKPFGAWLLAMVLTLAACNSSENDSPTPPCPETFQTSFSEVSVLMNSFQTTIAQPPSSYFEALSRYHQAKDLKTKVESLYYDPSSSLCYLPVGSQSTASSTLWDWKWLLIEHINRFERDY